MSIPKPPPGFTEEIVLEPQDALPAKALKAEETFNSVIGNLFQIALDALPPKSLKDWFKRMTTNNTTEVAQVFGRAAQGDVDAQYDMLERMVGVATQANSLCGESLAIIEVWARMLATHGRPQDKMRLGGVLIFKASVLKFNGNPEGAAAFLDEGTRILREAFELGYEPADTQRVELSRRFAMNIAIPAEVMLGDVAPTVQ